MITTDTANAPSKAAANKSSKPQRRMARPSSPEGEVEIDPALLADATTPAPAKPDAAPRVTKSASVIATIAELIEATGWLPHTTRAALTGLKKKGHVIAKEKRGDVTCYRIAPVAA